MKNKNKYIFLLLIASCLLVFLLIMPKLGLPLRSSINDARTRNLNDWRQAIVFYMEQNGDFPRDLYDVYQLNYREKSGIRIEFLTWYNHKRAKSLIYDNNILEDRLAFNEKIDYELIREDHNWYVQERKNYPPLFKDLWMIDQDGNISPVRQEVEK